MVKTDIINKKPPQWVAFKIGAGSIRAYPHAENTGLVISDGAKIGTFSNTSKFWSSEIKKKFNFL